jgi:hypothetical protein
MSENNQLLKEILKEVREIKAHIIPSSVSSNEDLTYIPELNKYVGPDYKMYSNKEKKMRKTRKNLRRLR